MGAALTTVLVVDDHQTFAELLADALDREEDLTSVGLATSAEEALVMVDELRPELVLMDVQLPGTDGIEATRQIVDRHPGTRVVVLTAHTDVHLVQRAADAGACAFLPKDGSLAEMLETVREARPGLFEFRPPVHDVPAASPVAPEAPDPRVGRLTPRELEVLGLMGEGLDVRTISRRLGVTEQTCRGYVKSVLAKLGVHSQLQAVVTAWRLGVLRPQDPA